MTSSLLLHLQDRIQREGPLSFRDFMEEALYNPEFGYYTGARNPIGREGDFYTSSDLDPIFGKLLAEKFIRMAEALGVPPANFTIVELGAGKGLLARDILKHCEFPYLILERSPAMRERQRRELAGFGVNWLDKLPSGITGCIFSNEFFDALPVRRVVRRKGQLREIYVTANLQEMEGTPQEELGDLPLIEGQLADIQVDSRRWIEQIAASIRRGFHLVIDYGYEDREFYARPRGTLMCYWKHQVSDNPYARIGEQDMTAHVNFSDLMKHGTRAGLETIEFATQMNFLVGLGIVQELESLVPANSAETVRRLMLIKKLIMPDAMGERFKVLVQRKT